MRMVGSAELESATSSVSRKRSNQLSYEPQQNYRADRPVTNHDLRNRLTNLRLSLPCQGSALTN